MGIPFMPKTPKYVLTSSMKAHTKVTKFVVDLSAATTIPTSLGIPNMAGNLDLAVKGPVDYSDKNKPAASLNIVSKDINIDYILKDNFHYFKINQIPAMYEAMLPSMGISKSMEQKFMNKWIYIDGTPLNTEARQELEKKNAKENTSFPQEVINIFFTTLKEKQFQNKLKMTSEKLEGVSTYKLQFNPDDALMDELDKRIQAYYDKTNGVPTPTPDTSENVDTSERAKGQQRMMTMDYPQEKPSDVLKNFSLTSWIDTNDYYVRKMTVTFDVLYDNSSAASPYAAQNAMMPAKEKVPVAITLKLSDYGVTKSIEKPSGATSIEEMYRTLNEEMMRQGGYGQPVVYGASTTDKKDNAPVPTPELGPPFKFPF
jgi:hypothetical protein